MVAHFGSDKINIVIKGQTCYPSVTRGLCLISSDERVLKDTHGNYITIIQNVEEND